MTTTRQFEVILSRGETVATIVCGAAAHHYCHIASCRRNFRLTPSRAQQCRRLRLRVRRSSKCLAGQNCVADRDFARWLAGRPCSLCITGSTPAQESNLLHCLQGRPYPSIVVVHDGVCRNAICFSAEVPNCKLRLSVRYILVQRD
jgi:hypothetical protein